MFVCVCVCVDLMLILSMQFVLTSIHCVLKILQKEGPTSDAAEQVRLCGMLCNLIVNITLLCA